MVTRLGRSVEKIIDLPDDGCHELVSSAHHLSPAPGSQCWQATATARARGGPG